VNYDLPRKLNPAGTIKLAGVASTFRVYNGFELKVRFISGSIYAAAPDVWEASLHHLLTEDSQSKCRTNRLNVPQTRSIIAEREHENVMREARLMHVAQERRGDMSNINEGGDGCQARR
jgi:hypothetical protein